jgi:UDP-N-acetylmuramyl pentapeptide phosphotransferase/UDP-N-acetylglucosamine-1-phosphate transferase
MDRGTLADFAVLAVLALAAALLSMLLVPLVRRLAVAGGAIDVPDARRVLVKPTPRLGGVAIFVASVVVMGVAAAAGRVSLMTAPPDVALARWTTFDASAPRSSWRSRSWRR